jgi:hypothetical protein
MVSKKIVEKCGDKFISNNGETYVCGEKAGHYFKHRCFEHNGDYVSVMWTEAGKQRIYAEREAARK